MRKLLIIILSVCFILQPIISQASMLFSSGGQQVVYRGTVTGLRISSADGVAFLDNIDITAEEANGKVVASGSVTQANMRISGVDGTAFIDTADATFAANITGNLGKYLVIKDSTGKAIKGWIKAAGTGETVSATDLMAGFDFTSGWTITAGDSVIDLNSFSTISGGGRGIYKNIFSSSANKLFKISYERTTTATASTLRIAKDDYSAYSGFVAMTTGSQYHTSIPLYTYLYMSHSSAGQTDVSSLKAEQVLTPSTSGVTITNTKGGTTYNWFSKETGFNYNDSSNYTYQVIDRSLSAFADGNYGIEVYDSSGRMLKGVAKAVGTEETLGDELLTGWTNLATNDKFETFNVSGSDINSAINTTDWGIAYNNIISPSEKLFKAVNSVFTLNSGTGPNFAITNVNSTSAGTFTKGATSYITVRIISPLASRISFYIGSTSDSSFTGTSVKQVLTPSTAGITIVSAKGGTTYNWQFKHASFAYNQSTNYVILKKLR